MAPRRTWSWLVLVAGLLLALASLFADPLGLGASPGFWLKQTLGLLVGAALVVLGAWPRR